MEEVVMVVVTVVIEVVLMVAVMAEVVMEAVVMVVAMAAVRPPLWERARSLKAEAGASWLDAPPDVIELVVVAV